MILVDSNILLDIVKADPVWARASLAALTHAAAQGPIAINDVIYAELSIGYGRIADLDAMVAAAGLTVAPIPRAALFEAGKAFLAYRRRGGTKVNVLPDFFIGAHAAAEGWPLLTRDTARVQSYFPRVQLLTP